MTGCMVSIKAFSVSLFAVSGLDWKVPKVGQNTPKVRVCGSLKFAIRRLMSTPSLNPRFASDRYQKRVTERGVFAWSDITMSFCIARPATVLSHTCDIPRLAKERR